MELLTPLSRFLHYADTIGDEVFLRQPVNTEWKDYSWKAAREHVLKVAHHLQHLDLPAHSNIAILSKNCAHWIMADLAIQAAGHVSVPLYANESAETIQRILEHSEARVIFVGKLDNPEKLENLPEGIHRIGFGLYGAREVVLWEDILSKGGRMKAPATPHASDLCTIMYTSGTTATPKGVMLTYGAIDFASANAIADLELPVFPRVFSYLPLSHIAERIGIEMIGLYLGATFSFAESLDTFARNLEETQPHLFFAVPRIWSKIRERILEQIPQKRLNLLLHIPLVNMIVRHKIRKRLGLASATHIFTGAAPVSVELLSWFARLRIEILQAYAMTENCCYGHFNLAHANKPGTVGRPLSEIHVKLSDEGEVLVKHNALMKGYYREPELTAAVFQDGFLKTGDTGSVDAEGYLTLTGRLKEQFKTDKGKLIAPTLIETHIAGFPHIDHVCVVGSGLPQPIALVTLTMNREDEPESVATSLQTSLYQLNTILDRVERVARIVILPEAWTIENGLLTPTLKVKRHELERRHRHSYLDWYNRNEVIIWN